MTGYYNNFYQGHHPSACVTPDPLDLFLSPPATGSSATKNEPQTRCAYPPDLISASSSDSASVGEDQRGMLKNNLRADDYSTALVPYYSSQQEAPSQKLVPASTTTLAPTTNTTTTTCTTLATTSTTTPMHKLIRVPRSHNPFGADGIHPQKNQMKKQRKGKTAAGAVGGMVVGGLTLGPAGVFLGAAAGAVATNKICKARERRAQRRYEQDCFQQAAQQSRVHAATFA